MYYPYLHPSTLANMLQFVLLLPLFSGLHWGLKFAIFHANWQYAPLESSQLIVLCLPCRYFSALWATAMFSAVTPMWPSPPLASDSASAAAAMSCGLVVTNLYSSSLATTLIGAWWGPANRMPSPTPAESRSCFSPWDK